VPKHSSLGSFEKKEKKAGERLKELEKALPRGTMGKLANTKIVERAHVQAKNWEGEGDPRTRDYKRRVKLVSVRGTQEGIGRKRGRRNLTRSSRFKKKKPSPGGGTETATPSN